jgi:hypothetical protein
VRFNKFTDTERAEIDSLIHDAYVDEDGEIRTHAAAAEEFSKSLNRAESAGREWAALMLDDWRDEGMKAFIAFRYKNSELFEFVRADRPVSRTLRRGTQRITEDGSVQWIQDSLMFWTIVQLEAAIADERRAIEDRQTNIAMYQALIELLTETGCSTVSAALDANKTTLAEYLAGRLSS